MICPSRTVPTLIDRADDTEAVKAMMEYARRNFGAKQFIASHAEPNTASGNVMKKCGLHFTGYGEFQKLDGSCKMRSMVYEGMF